jgi:hypothetical protein
VYVASIVPNSSADRCGLIQPDDELVRVDNVEIGPQVKNHPMIEFRNLPCANPTRVFPSPSLDAAARALTLCYWMRVRACMHVPQAVAESRLTVGVALGRSLLRMFAPSSSALLAAMSPSSSAAPQGTPRNIMRSTCMSTIATFRTTYRIIREAHGNLSRRAERRPVSVADICDTLDKCGARGG